MSFSKWSAPKVQQNFEKSSKTTKIWQKMKKSLVQLAFNPFLALISSRKKKHFWERPSPSLITGIQFHISYSGFKLTGVQSYSKKSLKVLLVLVLVGVIITNIWMFCSNEWIRIVSALFLNVTFFIICPATLVWLNENSQQYFILKLRQNITRRICYRHRRYRRRNRGSRTVPRPKFDGNINIELTEVSIIFWFNFIFVVLIYCIVLHCNSSIYMMRCTIISFYEVLSNEISTSVKFYLSTYLCYTTFYLNSK